MKITDPQKIKEFIDRNIIAELSLLFVSSDQYDHRVAIIDELIEKAKAFIGKIAKVIKIKNDDNKVELLLASIVNQSMFQEHKIIICDLDDNGLDIKNYNLSKTERKICDIIYKYLNQKQKSLLIISGSIQKLQGVFKKINIRKNIVYLAYPQDYKYNRLQLINSKLSNFLKNQQLLIDPDAIDLLKNKLSDNYLQAINTLDKLMIYTAYEQNININHVRLICDNYNKIDKNHFFKAILLKNTSKALNISSDLVKTTKDGNEINRQLLYFFQTLIKAKTNDWIRENNDFCFIKKNELNMWSLEKLYHAHHNIFSNILILSKHHKLTANSLTFLIINITHELA